MKLNRKMIILLIAALFSMNVAHSQGMLEITSESIVDGQIQKIHACYGQGGKDQSVQLWVLRSISDDNGVF